ncbi:MAG: Holliday junction resolvase RuvX [Ruminococcaceae bacterium]|nr:Holliday junction resolvase RuvX [Oscillospiraceae bacterium]
MKDRILAVDLGDVRTGIAVSDPLGMLANGVCTVRMTDKEKIAEMVMEYVKQYGATKIILGYPVNMNGSIGPRAENAAQFKELLARYTDIPVILYDERCTTMIAHTILSETNTRGKKRKNVVDTLSAEIILQNYLDANR